jgi:hypothetical protein
MEFYCVGIFDKYLHNCLWNNMCEQLNLYIALCRYSCGCNKTLTYV